MTTRQWETYDAGLLLWAGRERCGFVIHRNSDSNRDGYAFLEVDNVASDPATYFEMRYEDILVALNSSQFLVTGVWHSHPPGKPSPSDMDLDWHPTYLDLYIVCDLAIRRFSVGGVGRETLPWEVVSS